MNQPKPEPDLVFGRNNEFSKITRPDPAMRMVYAFSLSPVWAAGSCGQSIPHPLSF
jgi:hypothetical protein